MSNHLGTYTLDVGVDGVDEATESVRDLIAELEELDERLDAVPFTFEESSAPTLWRNVEIEATLRRMTGAQNDFEELDDGTLLITHDDVFSHDEMAVIAESGRMFDLDYHEGSIRIDVYPRAREEVPR